MKPKNDDVDREILQHQCEDAQQGNNFVVSLNFRS